MCKINEQRQEKGSIKQEKEKLFTDATKNNVDCNECPTAQMTVLS